MNRFTLLYILNMLRIQNLINSFVLLLQIYLFSKFHENGFILFEGPC